MNLELNRLLLGFGWVLLLVIETWTIETIRCLWFHMDKECA